MTQVLLVAVTGVITASVALISQWMRQKHEIRIERLKLRDEGTRRAYKRLFALARAIRNTCYPLADDKEEQFGIAMASHMKNDPQADYVYLDDETLDIVSQLEDHYACLKGAEPEFEAVTCQFIEKDLFDTVRQLESLTRKAIAL